MKLPRSGLVQHTLGEDKMANESDILWGMYLEHTRQGRHHESLRSTMTNMSIAICAGVLGLFALDNSPTTIHIIFSFFLIFLGGFGAVFSATHYERFRMHMGRAKGYRDALEQLLPETNIKSIKRKADSRIIEKYPRLSKLRLFWFWVSIHLLIAVTGGILASWSIAGVCAAA